MSFIIDKPLIKIGNIELKSIVAMSPLAGITDYVMRSLVRSYSADSLLTSEMISSEAIFQNKESQILYTDKKESPCVWQIEGHKPIIMAKAAKIIEDNNADIIDINMGCPIKKIVNGSDGCSLMKNPQLAQEIVIAVKETVKVPITCKFRLGWSEDSINFVEFAQLMQEAGVSAVTIHARTRTQMYSGHANWKALSELKGNIDIPYFANGDITNPQEAKTCLDISKADGITVGRALMGDLSLLYRIDKYLKEGVLIEDPDLRTKIQMLKKHLKLEIEFRGEEIGIKFFRKFYPYYIKGIKGSAEFRQKLITEIKYDKILKILDEIIAI